MEVELINADVPGGRIVLSDLPALIGRSQTADVCLNDPGVADFQCMIVQDGDSGMSFNELPEARASGQ